LGTKIKSPHETTKKKAADTPPPRKKKSTKHEYQTRVHLVVGYLREGLTRADICENMKIYANIPSPTCDHYIAAARKILDQEREEIIALVKKERHERELAALAKIPTPSELILSLLPELNVKDPVTTGFTVKVIKDAIQQIGHFPTEGHRQFIINKLLAYSMEVAKTATGGADAEEILTPLTNEQLTKISEILNE
jgi:hypothetical protein